MSQNKKKPKPNRFLLDFFQNQPLKTNRAPSLTDKTKPPESLLPKTGLLKKAASEGVIFTTQTREISFEDFLKSRPDKNKF